MKLLIMSCTMTLCLVHGMKSPPGKENISPNRGTERHKSTFRLQSLRTLSITKPKPAGPLDRDEAIEITRREYPIWARRTHPTQGSYIDAWFNAKWKRDWEKFRRTTKGKVEFPKLEILIGCQRLRTPVVKNALLEAYRRHELVGSVTEIINWIDIPLNTDYDGPLGCDVIDKYWADANWLEQAVHNAGTHLLDSLIQPRQLNEFQDNFVACYTRHRIEGDWERLNTGDSTLLQIIDRYQGQVREELAKTKHTTAEAYVPVYEFLKRQIGVAPDTPTSGRRRLADTPTGRLLAESDMSPSS